MFIKRYYRRKGNNLREICILDAKTLGPGINLSPLEQWGRLKVYATTAPHETAERIANSEII